MLPTFKTIWNTKKSAEHNAKKQRLAFLICIKKARPLFFLRLTFCTLQTLFPYLKIAIFCRIVPRWNSWKFRHSKFFVPLQTLFPSLKIAIFCRIAPRSKSENPHASFSMCCARFFCYVSKRLDFFKLHSVAHNCSIRIWKSANVGHFYFNRKAIFYKVVPRNFLCTSK